MQISILGSCAGTEPMPGRKHTSWMLGVGECLYCFDAGEGCSRTAHLMGLDLTRLRGIFISHVHHDHVAGLAGLLENVRAVSYIRKEAVAVDRIPIYIPELALWENVYQFLKYTTDGHTTRYSYAAQRPSADTFYDDGVIRVSGYETRHMAPAQDGSCRSFAYRIEAEGKAVVFSGDIRYLEELTPAVGSGCDLLLCETGHHSVKAVCDFAQTHPVKKLLFVHNGREILYEKPSVQEAIDACTVPAIIGQDRQQLTL